MKYKTIFARSFSREERKKLRYGAFVGCFIVAVGFCMLFKPYLKAPLIMPNLRLSMGMADKLLSFRDAVSPRSSPRPTETANKTETADKPETADKSETANKTETAYKPETANKTETACKPETADIPSRKVMKPPCDVSGKRSDYCDINGYVRIHGRSSTIFVAPPSSQTGFSTAANNSWTIQPYARKGDPTAMKGVTKFSVRLPYQQPPNCTMNHGVPAVVFSLAGYSGNHFHAFTDTVVPLFAASRRFNGEVQFLITNEKHGWITKFHAVLERLSNYEIISIDKEDHIHCFPSMMVGLYTWQRELSIDPSKSPYSMTDFKRFLRQSYSLNRTTAIKLREGKHQRKPQLLIISRQRTRTFMNEPKITKMARRLGFTVIVTEATSNLSKFAEIVNSCDVLMGVHGAGLTNMVFLPERAILIQIVPLGTGWMSSYDFGKPAAEMNIRYLEYKIREKESTLREQYPQDHAVFRDPSSIWKLGWGTARTVYLGKQNVKLDVARLGATLSEALQLLHQ